MQLWIPANIPTVATKQIRLGRICPLLATRNSEETDGERKPDKGAKQFGQAHLDMKKTAGRD